MNARHADAQGTIEYLVIIAIIVVIGLVVVSLATGLIGAPGTQLASASTDIGSMTGPISMSSPIVGSDGSGLVSLQNNTGETVSISKVSVGGSDVNYNGATMAAGQDSLFQLSGVSGACSCAGYEGKTRACDVQVNAVSASGLTKTYSSTVTVNCVASAQTAPGTPVIPPAQPQQQPPSVALLSPSAGATIGSPAFVFTVSTTADMNYCALIKGGVAVATINSPAKDANQTFYLPDGTVGPDTNTWTVSCTDMGGLTGTAVSRGYTNPYSVIRYEGACGALTTANSYHMLTRTIYIGGTCFTLAADNITFDGNGFSLSGVTYGISGLTSGNAYTGLVVKNVKIYGFLRGIYLGAPTTSTTTGFRGGSVKVYDSNINRIETTAGTMNASAGGAVGGDSGDVEMHRSTIYILDTMGPVSQLNTAGTVTTGRGGNIAAFDSNVGTITATGTQLFCSAMGQTCTLTAGKGGDLNFTNSALLGAVTSKGGGCTLMASTCAASGGNGGNVRFNPCVSPLPNIDLNGGRIGSGTKYGTDGTITGCP